MSLVNLESICSEFGYKIAAYHMTHPGEFSKERMKISDMENVITKGLGVLTENGLYAMGIFFLACKFSVYGTFIAETMIAMLSRPEIALAKQSLNSIDILNTMRSLTESLPKLILAKRLFEQTLTFGRYHCKAMDKKGWKS